METPTEKNPHYLRQFFVYEHLRPDLKPVSQAFAELARDIDAMLPENPEKTTALRKLLEAKDCAVRAALFEKFFQKEGGQPVKPHGSMTYTLNKGG